MAKVVLTNVQVMLNSVNLSAWVDNVSLEESYADVDTTAFGSTAKTRMAGLGDHKVTIEFQNDWAVAAVDATVRPLLGATTTLTLTPNATNPGTTGNPTYTCVVLVNQWKDLDGKIGDLAKSSITWPVSGSITPTPAGF